MQVELKRCRKMEVVKLQQFENSLWEVMSKGKCEEADETSMRPRNSF